MPLKFSIDPQTGVVVPPVTVFNGGRRKTARRGAKSKRKASRKSKRKSLRRRH